jgi:hypothetical protein
MGPHERLTAYIRAVRDVPFAWGEHDCLTFTNNAYRAMYGAGWADDWLGRYMIDGSPMRRRALMAELSAECGVPSLEAAIDSKMTRVPHPPRGALVTTKHAQRWITGVAMGICIGTRGVFLGKEGVIYMPVEYIEKAWIK